MNVKAIALFSLILIALGIIQSTLGHFVSIFKIKPDLVLIVLIFLTAQFGSMTGMYMGFFGGLAIDLLTGCPLGLFAFIFTTLGFVFGLGKGSIFFDPIFIPMVIILGGTVLKYLLYFFLGIIFSLNLPFPFQAGFLIEVLYNCVLAIPLFHIIMALKRRFSRPGVGFDG